MTSELRVVLDTNVVISAVLLPQSVSRQAFDRVLDLGRLLISAATVEELNDVFRRDRFDKYVREDQRLEFLASLIHEAELVNISEAIVACRDPKDDKFLELAVNGRATCIITGDNDLLVLNPFRNIPILTPSDFMSESKLNRAE